MSTMDHLQANEEKRVLIGGGFVFFVGVLIRSGLRLIYPAAVYTDTDRYRYMANAILTDWNLFNGTRAPGYPLFMALAGDDNAVYIAQLALGLVISLAFFAIGWMLTHNIKFAVLAGLLYTLNLGQLFFEATLLSETLTTFWIVLTFTTVVLWLSNSKHRSILLAIAISILSALAALTRAQYLFLPFLIAVVLILVEWFDAKKIRWADAAGLIIPAILIIGLWSQYIHQRFGMFGITTTTGFHLMQNTGSFFEYAPEEYADLRDTYLKYRAIRIAERGVQSNTIWQAIPEMQKVSGLSFYELSQTLTKISVQLILKYPHLYLKSVLYSWWMFWRAPVYWQPELILNPFYRSLIGKLITVERFCLFGSNMVFIVSSIGIVSWRKLRRFLNLPVFLWLVAGTIWINSAVQALMEQGENPRFLIPLQSLVILWLVWILISLWDKRSRIKSVLRK